tara:strand:+ start:679 stop:936 length:258 start_codon:yes stop_codon:yes gene_type:complete
MQNYTVESLTVLKDKIEELSLGEGMSELDCKKAIKFIRGMFKEIESNSIRYGEDSLKMQNLCLMAEFFLETRITKILEYNDSINS